MGVPSTRASTSVAICVITYMRPVGLERLLGRLERLETCGAAVSVVVVDNDPSGSAEPLVEAARRSGSLDIRYHVEKERGITHARNAALRVAEQLGVEWIAWIDDDEAPHPDWLRLVLETQRATDADVVIGPSVPIYEPGSTPWLVDSGAFETERFVTGQPFPFFHTRTSGVIQRSSAVPPEGFDNRLALSGGSDRVFFTRIHRAGGRFVWDDRAIVDEWVPRSRVRAAWLVKRWFRTGVTRSLTMLILDDPSWARRLRRVLGGLAMTLTGLYDVVRAVPRGRTAMFLATRRILLGAGAAYGALGLHYREYRTIHGS